MNTKRSGAVNFIIYKDIKDSLYTAVCLDFDIVEQGINPELLRKSIEDAAKMHVETVINMNLNENLLNRKAPKVYWNRAKKAVAAYENSLEDEAYKREKLSLRDIWVRNTQELVGA